MLVALCQQHSGSRVACALLSPNLLCSIVAALSCCLCISAIQMAPPTTLVVALFADEDMSRRRVVLTMSSQDHCNIPTTRHTQILSAGCAIIQYSAGADSTGKMEHLM